MERLLLHDFDYRGVVDVSRGGAADSGDDIDALIREITPDPRITGLLITERCILKRIEALAGEILSDYPSGPIETLPVLAGTFMFAPDLARALYRAGAMDVRFHFAKLSTYANGIKSGGETHRAVHTHLFPEDLAGKDILIVEDIIDQGFTMRRLRQMLLEEKKANSVRICALLVKRLDNPTEEVRRAREGLTIDYAGFSFPDVWIAGYGIDAAGEFRNVPHIITVNEALYR